MNRQAGWRWLHSVLMLSSVVAIVACHRGTPEAALRARLQEMQAAAGESRIGDFMEGVSQDFVGNQGMDRAALHNLLSMAALGRSNVGVSTGPLQIEMRGEQATVKFNAVLAGGSGRFLPDSAQILSITSGWRIEDGNWRVHYAQWEPEL